MKANITWLTGTLATGGDLALLPEDAYEQRQDILDQGVKWIVDLRVEASDEAIWADKDVTYIHAPTDDRIGWSIPPEVFDTVLEAARTAEALGEKILVHCHMGVNRGPSAAYAVLLDRGMDFIQAYDLIRAKRPMAGLSYVEDALKAWCIQERIPPKEGRQMVAALQEHVARTWTPEEIETIDHIIREHHEWDAEQFRVLEAREQYDNKEEER